MDIQLLEKLCLAIGISGEEDHVRRIIIDEIRDFADIELTNLGDIIARKKGEKKPEKTLMLAAHMDEVGLVVTDITEDGYIKFGSVGGIDSGVLLGKSVYVNGKIKGLIGGKPVHLMHGDEFEKTMPMDKLTVDIGAENREEAEKYAAVGDNIHFEPYFYCDGSTVFGKALDDRVGCLLLIEMIKSKLPYDMTFVFTTREEIGSIGAKVASGIVQPDLAIAVEGTVAGDVLGAKGAKACTQLLKGPALSIKDKGTVYDKAFYKLAFKLAGEIGVPCQPRTSQAGSNDASQMHIAGRGARAAALSIPCRYIHSPLSIAKVGDIEAGMKLLPLLAQAMIEAAV